MKASRVQGGPPGSVLGPLAFFRESSPWLQEAELPAGPDWPQLSSLPPLLSVPNPTLEYPPDLTVTSGRCDPPARH